MRHLTRDQARAPKRDTESISLPEYSAPLLLAKPSADLVVGLRERKLDFGSRESLTSMVADMVVDESGSPMFAPEDVPAFLKGISADSLTLLMNKCVEMMSRKAGDVGNSKPSTSAA